MLRVFKFNEVVGLSRFPSVCIILGVREFPYQFAVFDNMDLCLGVKEGLVNIPNGQTSTLFRLSNIIFKIYHTDSIPDFSRKVKPIYAAEDVFFLVFFVGVS